MTKNKCNAILQYGEAWSFKTIPTITMRLPYNQQRLTKTLFLTEEQQAIKPLFDLERFLG